MILFLDYDGVLHPDEVFLTKSGPKLCSAGQLFMWAPILEELLRPYPEIQIVLSTSWVRHLGFTKAKNRLSEELQGRVVGSTWHSSMGKNWADQIWWDQSSRYRQILRYVTRAMATEWIALDDDAANWPSKYRSRLVHVAGAAGLSSRSAQADLIHKISSIKGSDVSSI